jgi:hypothetical protein
LMGFDPQEKEDRTTVFPFILFQLCPQLNFNRPARIKNSSPPCSAAPPSFMPRPISMPATADDKVVRIAQATETAHGDHPLQISSPRPSSPQRASGGRSRR